MQRLVFALTLMACGSRASTPPPAKPAATAECKADSTLIGTPCTEEGKVCGAGEAAKSTGFSNVLRCTSGRWENVEVPPPPPPH